MRGFSQLVLLIGRCAQYRLSRMGGTVLWTPALGVTVLLLPGVSFYRAL